jgi:putative FmdB family regulatory protein
MPIFEYECDKCGYITEKLIIGKEDKDKVKCICGKIMKKLVSKSSFKLNGPGFYVNDYKKKEK